jgi:hypothetical protein
MALQGIPSKSRRSPARLRQPSWGFTPLQRHEHGRSTNPGFQPRYVPPPEFLTLLTVCSLPGRPATRTGATHGVRPAELFPSAEPYALRRRCPLAVSGIAFSCSENQKITMPRSSRALLPAKIRTRASRSSQGPMLSWAFLASPEHSPHAGGSASRSLPSCTLSTHPAGGGVAGAPGHRRTRE